MTKNQTSFVESWPEPHKARLKELVGTGSFSQITDIINEEFFRNYSRNAVIGKAKRMGLCQLRVRDNVRSSFNRVRRSHVAKPKKQNLLRADGDRGRRKSNFVPHKPGSLPLIPETFPETARPFLDSSVEVCRWPTSGAGDSMHICGAPAEIGSYCVEHAQRAYAVMPTRKRNVVLRTTELLEYKDHG